MRSPQRISVATVAATLAAAAVAGVVAAEPAAAAVVGSTVAGGNGQGSAANQLWDPTAIAVDGSNNLYVVDSLNQRVQKWAPGATSGVTVAGGNGLGSAADQLDQPLDVALDATGNLYVADSGNHRVQKWAPGATAGVTVAGGNGPGAAANELYFPGGVAVNGFGDVFVADTTNQRVQEWTPNATSGVTVAGGNGFGSAADQFANPERIALDSKGNMFVSDVENQRVQEWAPGAASGVTVAGGNGSGSADNQLADPGGLAVTSFDEVLVADTSNHRVQLWQQGATSGITIAGGNGQGSAADQLSFPSDVAFSSNNYYVSDASNDRVLQFQVTQAQITAPPDQTVSTDPGTCTATVHLTPFVVTGGFPPPYVFITDEYNGQEGVPLTNSTTSATFPLGTTVVLGSQTPFGLGSGGVGYNVTVVDNEPPTITQPANVVVPATSSKGAVVIFPTPVASDNCPGPLFVTTSPKSGSFFLTGVTTVNVTATDQSDNTASTTFTVTVEGGFQLSQQLVAASAGHGAASVPLVATADAISSSLARNRTIQACVLTGTYQVEVRVLTLARLLSPSTAADLVTLARQTATAAGCG